VGEPAQCGEHAALQLAGTRRDVTEPGIVGVPAHRLADAAGEGLMMGDLRMVSYDRGRKVSLQDGG